MAYFSSAHDRAGNLPTRSLWKAGRLISKFAWSIHKISRWAFLLANIGFVVFSTLRRISIGTTWPLPPLTSMSQNLHDTEIFWRDHQKWLQSEGYMLRARYMPNWKPSWEGTDKLRTLCEDWIVPNVGYHHSSLFLYHIAKLYSKPKSSWMLLESLMATWSP